MERVHASCVDLDGRGVLLTGPSGCGKSDLAVRLIDGGAQLVADDYALLSLEDGQLTARCPDTIQGKIELRHLGILTLPALPATRPALVLAPAEGPLERLPEPAFLPLLGVQVPLLRLPYFEASTPAKIRLWLAHGSAR